MVTLRLKPWLKSLSLTFSLWCIEWHSAYAGTAGGGLPFDTTLEKLKDDITGPVLMYISCIMIVITFVMLAFGEWGDGFKRIITVVLWLSVAFAVVSFITTLFGNGAVC